MSSRRAAAARCFALAVLGGAAVGSCDGDGTRAAPESARASAKAGQSTRTRPARNDSVVAAAPLVPTPDTVRGLYVNRWAAIGTSMWRLVDVAKRTEVNALVIDVKDDRGLMLYRTGVPLAQEIGADTTYPMAESRLRAVLDSLRAHRIYPIARIVVAKDPLLADRRREWAIRRKDDSTQVWLDKHGRPWLDPTHPEVWKYAADISAEAVRLGFSELQFDYVRFPDEDRVIDEGRYAHMEGRVRAEVIRDQLTYLRQLVKPLRVRTTIDVFGLTATDSTDMGIGQRWEMFIDRADVVLPMVYPSHFAPGTYGLANPNAKPYETIGRALEDVTRRTQPVANAAKIVPWYQDFTLGPPRYRAEEVRAQIKSGYASGYASWILWNPGSRYTVDALLPDPLVARDSLRADTSRDTLVAAAKDSAP
ncbi:MAG TPA: putative glycoside hydrolase [Gemmatimonadaceae bacterium]|nr:putative glycoside hydrolase [Gemmatimonadaceae bacterium]